MGHNVSDRKLREIAAAERFARDQREAPARAREIALAGKVVELWNARLARGAEMFFAPTIGGAVAGGHPWLTFYCPGCQTVGEVDLRRVDRHRGASVQSLIPALSCTRCQPLPPFVKLIGLAPVPQWR
jgi:hypothetical protein